MFNILNKSLVLRKYFAGKLFDLKKNEDLAKLMSAKGNNVIDFYADWCKPCKMVHPVLEEITKNYDINVIKVNIDNHENLAQKFNVSSIPYFLFIKDNEMINSHVGMLNKAEILKKFNL